MIPNVTQFNVVRTPSGKKAYEGWAGSFKNWNGQEFTLVAPSLDDLKQIFEQVTSNELIVEGAQHIWIVSAEKDAPPDDAPGVKPAAANVACSVTGCTKQAAFIINRKSLCEEHRNAK